MVSFPQVFLPLDLCLPLPCWSDLLGWHEVFFYHYLWSLGCWQDLFLSPALLCSPSMSTLCLAGGELSLPVLVSLSAPCLWLTGKICFLIVNCCTFPGRLQELARFGFNQYWHSLETSLKVIAPIYDYPMWCDWNVFEVLLLAISFPFKNWQIILILQKYLYELQRGGGEEWGMGRKTEVEEKS